jgi:hypothetical protein
MIGKSMPAEDEQIKGIQCLIEAILSEGTTMFCMEVIFHRTNRDTDVFHHLLTKRG